jgi:hypothetical protein
MRELKDRNTETLFKKFIDLTEIVRAIKLWSREEIFLINGEEMTRDDVKDTLAFHGFADGYNGQWKMPGRCEKLLVGKEPMRACIAYVNQRARGAYDTYFMLGEQARKHKK